MLETRSFIVLEGYLHETMEFEMLQGYEVQAAPQENRVLRKDHIVTAMLLDDAGQPLVMASPELQFSTVCSVTPTRPEVSFFQVFLARHPSTRYIELRAYDRQIFKARVGSEPPPPINIILGPKSEDKSIQFSFDRPLQPEEKVQFFLLDATDRRFPVNPTPSGNEYSIDLQQYAGREHASISVIVSQDFRSINAISPPFDLPPTTIRGRILEPLNQAEYSAGISGSLIANLFDDTGRAIPWNKSQVTWVLDGSPLQDSRQTASFDDLASGPHTVELRYQTSQGQTILLDRVSFLVREETEAQKEYKAILSEYFAAQKGTSSEKLK